jgi:hypothetical protein
MAAAAEEGWASATAQPRDSLQRELDTVASGGEARADSWDCSLVGMARSELTGMTGEGAAVVAAAEARDAGMANDR